MFPIFQLYLENYTLPLLLANGYEPFSIKDVDFITIILILNNKHLLDEGQCNRKNYWQLWDEAENKLKNYPDQGGCYSSSASLCSKA